jgi:hypothetical protein
MLAAATPAVLTVLPAGGAQAGVADEPGQRVLERTLAREHHAVAVPTDPAAPPKRRTKEDTMRPTHRALATLALGLTLVAATTAAAAATPPTGTQDQADQRRALYQSELERTLARHRALGALDAIAAQPASAAQPATRTDLAAPSPGVDVLATLLVGLVGGVLGGAAAMVGWTTIRRRRPRTAAGT